MSHIKHSVLEFAGDFATAHPKAWLYSFMLLGMATGIAIYGGAGYWLGGFVNHATTGMYLGLAYYGWWFASKVEVMSAMVDQQVALLKRLRSELY